VAVRPRRSLRQNWLRVGNAVFAGGLRLNFLRKGMRILAIVRPRTRCSIYDTAQKRRLDAACVDDGSHVIVCCSHDRKGRIRNRRFRNSFLSDRERSRVDLRDDRTVSCSFLFSSVCTERFAIKNILSFSIACLEIHFISKFLNRIN